MCFHFFILLEIYKAHAQADNKDRAGRNDIRHSRNILGDKQKRFSDLIDQEDKLSNKKRVDGEKNKLSKKFKFIRDFCFSIELWICWQDEGKQEDSAYNRIPCCNVCDVEHKEAKQFHDFLAYLIQIVIP